MCSFGLWQVQELLSTRALKRSKVGYQHRRSRRQSAVEGLCGQLTFIDHQSRMISLVHTTVREFLLRDFAQGSSRAHERSALTCLKLLSNGEMNALRSPRMLSQSRTNQELLPPMSYTITQFSGYVYSASAETDHVSLALELSFKTNALSWDRKGRSDGRSVSLSQVYGEFDGLFVPKRQVHILDSWSTILSRIATKFGSAPLQDPWSHLIRYSPLLSAQLR